MADAISPLDALIYDLNATAGFAEQEATDLRIELRAAHESLITIKFSAWKYHQTLIPFMRRLQLFHQISAKEVDDVVASQAKDRKTIERDIRSFRRRYGAQPNYHGKPLEWPK